MANSIQTSCEHCVFRDGLKCTLNLVQSYESQGRLTPLEDRDYHILNGVCLSMRYQKWLIEQEEESLVAIFKDRSVCVNHIVIFDGNFKKLGITLKSISKQTMVPNKPHRVILAFKKGVGVIKDCVKFLEDKLGHTNFFISELLNDPSDENQIVDSVFNRCSNGYYYVIKSGYKIPPNMYECLYNVVFREGLQCIAILPEKGVEGTCMSAVIHKFLKGSSFVDLRSKIEALCQDQKVGHMIHSWDKVYENLSSKTV